MAKKGAPSSSSGANESVRRPMIQLSVNIFRRLWAFRSCPCKQLIFLIRLSVRMTNLLKRDA